MCTKSFSIIKKICYVNIIQRVDRTVQLVNCVLNRHEDHYCGPRTCEKAEGGRMPLGDRNRQPPGFAGCPAYWWAPRPGRVSENKAEAPAEQHTQSVFISIHLLILERNRRDTGVNTFNFSTKEADAGGSHLGTFLGSILDILSSKP